MRAVIFGASGLLGRSVMRAFNDMTVTGTGFSRTAPGLARADATSADDIDRLLGRAQPDVVVNCVGERRPQRWAATPDQARDKNVDAARLLAQSTRQCGARLLHISTDYVFDGKAAPYRPDSPPNPLNAYGRWKLLAEHAVRAACPDAAILRLPVLYGPAQFAAETNLTELARQVGARAPVELDDVCVRYPTHTDEAAEVCRWLAGALVRGQRLGAVAHWSAEQGFTKYQMAVLIADRFGLPAGHIRPGEADAVSGDRPIDCRLDCRDLPEALGTVRRHFTTEFPPVVEPWLLPAEPISTLRKDFHAPCV
ncbi:dTDP-4-dehydrorhamnose reductase family protein [Streptomyces nigrescens]|uniref:dTDP-4-dehydrorhamnose reductase n=1 Tax=Streptomyces nigrescens TaxID=1920 RepID=A0ABY7J0N8_STRNI|nr:SDR family oxidoreductase [Streptomyces nigrescens]WAU04115.1 SDR family oxidoreductase [Streptomyces nigrescens]